MNNHIHPRQPQHPSPNHYLGGYKKNSQAYMKVCQAKIIHYGAFSIGVPEHRTSSTSEMKLHKGYSPADQEFRFLYFSP
tara:strand:+ start:1964 stop:2200 length:237 start_codon:yes stop_codon:yes gene_type:complete